MKLSLSLALNVLMDENFKFAFSEFHFFAPVNFMLRDAIVFAFGSHTQTTLLGRGFFPL